MKRYLTLWSILLLITITLAQTANARRLKVYRLPKQIVAGQLGIIIFENPTPDKPRSQTSCTAPKFIAWTKSDVPILRVEQNGKQVWTSLGSYQSVGDSCIATFMAPVSLVPGPATVFIVNGTDPSTPYPLHVEAKPVVELTGMNLRNLNALGTVRIYGDGFVPEVFTDKKKLTDELESNIGLSKLSKTEQWMALNHRIAKDWEKLPEGDYILLEQSGMTWKIFVEECGIDVKGMSLDFIVPPDVQEGMATITVVAILNGKEAARTTAMPVNIE